jgi:hypothetical protein
MGLMHSACKLKHAFEAVAPFIEKHTSSICPLCEKVCCVNKHSYHDREDSAFLSALEIETISHESDLKDTEPCRFLRKYGCSLERWKRPFRCTWYFCEPLLARMSEGGGREYRDFIQCLQKLISLRQIIITEVHVTLSKEEIAMYSNSLIINDN